MVNIYHNTDEILLSDEEINKYVEYLDNQLELANKYFSLILIDDESMHQYNYEYRNIDRSTDVLTFVDYQDDYLGDIYINEKRVVDQAKEYNHSIKREFLFLITHGVLHLLGYDHQTKEEEKIMFEKQEQLLSNYGVNRGE